MTAQKEMKLQMKAQAKEIDKAYKSYKTKHSDDNVIVINHLLGISTKLRVVTYREYELLSQDLTGLKKTDYSMLDNNAIDRLRAQIKNKTEDIGVKYHLLNDLDAQNKALYELVFEKMGREYNFLNGHDLAEFILDLLSSE